MKYYCVNTAINTFLKHPKGWETGFSPVHLSYPLSAGKTDFESCSKSAIKPKPGPKTGSIAQWPQNSKML